VPEVDGVVPVFTKTYAQRFFGPPPRSLSERSKVACCWTPRSWKVEAVDEDEKERVLLLYDSRAADAGMPVAEVTWSKRLAGSWTLKERVEPERSLTKICMAGDLVLL